MTVFCLFRYIEPEAEIHFPIEETVHPSVPSEVGTAFWLKLLHCLRLSELTIIKTECLMEIRCIMN